LSALPNKVRHRKVPSNYNSNYASGFVVNNIFFVGVFKGIPNPFTVTRYHSLAIEKSSIPAALEITATSSDGEIMGVRHREFAVEGVQFHPESILSEHGHALLKNFLQSK